MIQIRNKIGSVAPKVLTNEGVAKTDNYKTEFNNGATEFKFDSGIYGHKEVKERLVTLQQGKCCFCESKIRHISYGDVEHYRPKAGWVQNKEPINKPGYYWLAYDWDNLLLSCQLCNQQFKKNYFPLLTENSRARNHNEDINNEDPLFIHPANENPEEYIEFNEEMPIAVDNKIRGTVTITNLGLDRELLNEQRKKTLNMVSDIYNLAKNFPDNPPELKKVAKDKITKYHVDSGRDETEYASMLRCFFRKNPIDF